LINDRHDAAIGPPPLPAPIPPARCQGAACSFRHAPAALGSFAVCDAWASGSCNVPDCPRRHYQDEKNRAATFCFWETNGGCKKGVLCPFKHRGQQQQLPPPQQHQQQQLDPDPVIRPVSASTAQRQNVNGMGTPTQPTQPRRLTAAAAAPAPAMRNPESQSPRSRSAAGQGIQSRHARRAQEAAAAPAPGPLSVFDRLRDAGEKRRQEEQKQEQKILKQQQQQRQQEAAAAAASM